MLWLVVLDHGTKAWSAQELTTENTNHEFPHVEPKEPIKMLDVFYAWNVLIGAFFRCKLF